MKNSSDTIGNRTRDLPALAQCLNQLHNRGQTSLHLITQFVPLFFYCSVEWTDRHTSQPVVKYCICRTFRFFIYMLPRIVIYFFLNNQPDALIIPNLFCYKTLHVSGNFSAHHQEFSIVNSALVSFLLKFS